MNSSPYVFRLVLLLLAISLGTSACAGRERGPNFTDQYMDALERFPASTDTDIAAGVERFIAVFSHLTHDDVGDRARAAYADQLFFNDTLHTANSGAQLAQYLVNTGEAVDGVDVEVLSWIEDKGDVYVRWTMRTRFSVTGRKVDSRTIGMTHLRFNDAGQITLHQDFWDSSQGLYEHIPVMGGMVRWIRGRL